MNSQTSPIVILVEPTHPGNVGSTARAMNNMGASDLRLVNPCDHLDREAYRLASNSEKILESATVYNSLEEAVSDCQLIIGTSSRARDRQQEVSSLWDLNKLLTSFPIKTKTALVFGRERSGLTNREMDLCNGWVTIPTFGKSFSLNLAQAVILVLYEYSKSVNLPEDYNEKKLPPAKSKNLEGLKEHLFLLLDKINYIKPGKKDSLWSNFSDLLSRSKADENEVRMLRGFLHKVELYIKRKAK